MSDTSKGILYMTLSCLIMGGLWALVRIASEDLHPMLLVFYRNFFGLLMMVPMILRIPKGAFKTPHWRLHMGRALTMIISVYCIFYAITQIPLATVVAITYAAPIFATIGAVLFLGEVIHLRRIMAILIGFGGVLLVLLPGMMNKDTPSFSSDGLIAALIGTVSIAFAIMYVKLLANRDETKLVVAMPFMIVTPISFLLALPYWQWLTLPQFGLMAIIGVGISSAQYLLTMSFKHADATAVLPLDFIRLLVATVLGIWLFHEPADKWVVLGAVIILTSTVYTAHREARLAKQPTEPPVT